MDATGTRRFTRHTLIFLGLLALALLLWRIWFALLLAFGAVLVAIFLRKLAAIFQARTGLPIRYSVVVVAMALLGLVVAGAFFAGAAVAGELSELGEALTRAVRQINSYLAQTAWGQQLLETAKRGAEGGSSFLVSIPGLMFTMLDAILGVVIIIFAGGYLAIAPGLYTEGAVRLAPKHRQPRLREVLETLGNALWLWLLARMVVMILVASVTWIGLTLVGVPLAMPLALIAGLLEFIPFFGPILAGVPILLVALSVDPQTALYAALLVLVIQQIEGNILEPLVEQKAVSLPPALILIAAVAFMLLFGPVGAVFASPLLLVAIVSTKMLYMEDTLGQDVEVAGAPQQDEDPVPRRIDSKADPD